MHPVIEYIDDIYKQIPRTVGCEKANSANGCKSWCCKNNTPSMYLSEFSYLYNKCLSRLEHKDILDIILACVRNYLSNSIIKGCPLHDSGSMKCLTHRGRPLSCRLYGIIHKNSWKKKEKYIKQTFASHPQKKQLFNILEQCDLVRTHDGHKHVKETLEQELFEKTRVAEKMLGISDDTITLHDAPGGSYRTVHDHVLISFLGESFMSNLTKVRAQDPSKEIIDEIVENLRKELSKPGQEVAHADSEAEMYDTGREIQHS